jgi:hypothetical protein
MRLFRVAVVAGVFVYFTGSSQASTTYTYTGTNYVNIVDATPLSGSYTTSMNVTGSVTLTNALGPNSPLQFINDVETFSFSDGRILYIPQNSALPLFATGLGALGLLGWRRKRNNTV